MALETPTPLAQTTAGDQNTRVQTVNSIRDIEETVIDADIQKKKLEKVLDKTRCGYCELLS